MAMSEWYGPGKVCAEPVEEQVKEESGLPWGQTAEVLRNQIRERNSVCRVLLETRN